MWHRMGKAPLHGVKAPPLHPHLSQCLLAATHRVGKRPGRRMVTWDRYVRPLQRARVCVRVVRLPCKVASTRIAVFARAKSATHTTDLIKSPARAAPPLWLLGVCHRRTPLSMSLAHRVFMFCSARPTKIRLICHRNRTYRDRRNWFLSLYTSQCLAPCPTRQSRGRGVFASAGARIGGTPPGSTGYVRCVGLHLVVARTESVAHCHVVSRARCACRRLPTAHGKDRPPHDLMP